MEISELREQLLNVGDQVIKYSRDLNVESAEAFILIRSIIQILENKGKVESRTGIVEGVGIRTAIGKKVGFASCTGFSKDTLKKCIQDSYEIAMKSPDMEKFPGFVSTNENSQEGILDEDILNLTPVDMSNHIKTALKQVDFTDDRIKGLEFRGKVEWGGFSVATTEGCNSASLKTAYFTTCIATVADQNDRKINHDVIFGREIQDSTEIAKKTVERAFRSLGSQSFGKTETLPLILHPRAASAIFGAALPQMVNGDLYVEQRSPLKDKIGEVIASTNFSVVDDGQIPNSLGTKAIDHEGTPVSERKLFTDGKFEGYLFDKKFGKASTFGTTGNAYRGSNLPFENSPMIAPHKLIIQPVAKNLDEIISGYDKAIYLESDPQGLHTMNILSGDFNVTSNDCYLVENGEIKTPLKNMSISGNFYNVLKGIEKIGSDLTPASNFLDSPSIVLKDISFSG